MKKDVLESRKLSLNSAGNDINRVGEGDMFQMAANCMLDALAGRDKHGLMSISQQSKTLQYAFKIQTSYAEWLIFCSAVTLHTVLAFLEDQFATPAIALTCIILLVYSLDITLKMVYMSPRDYLTKIWNVGQVMNSILITDVEL